VKSRTAGMVQLRDLIVTAPQALRDRLSRPKTIRGKLALCRRLRPSTGELGHPTHAAKFALRSIAQRIDSLDAEIAVLDRQLEQLVSTVAPRTTEFRRWAFRELSGPFAATCPGVTTPLLTPSTPARATNLLRRFRIRRGSARAADRRAAATPARPSLGRLSRTSRRLTA
jgi:hypothetical protein